MSCKKQFTMYQQSSSADATSSFFQTTFDSSSVGRNFSAPPPSTGNSTSNKFIQYKDNNTQIVDHVSINDALPLISKLNISIHRRDDSDDVWCRFHKLIPDCADRWMCRRETDDGAAGKLFKIKIENFLVDDPVVNFSDYEAVNLSD